MDFARHCPAIPDLSLSSDCRNLSWPSSQGVLPNTWTRACDRHFRINLFASLLLLDHHLEGQESPYSVIKLSWTCDCLLSNRWGVPFEILETQCQEVPPMMRETQKGGPKDLRPISLEELKKHSHQAGPGCMPHLARDERYTRSLRENAGEIMKRTSG